MCERDIIKLKGIAAVLEYMSSSDAVDVLYTKEAISMIAELLYEIVDAVRKEVE